MAGGLLRVTSAKGRRDAFSASVVTSELPIPPVYFRLVLSAPATSVKIDTGMTQLSDQETGTLELDPGNPRVSLAVHWKSPAEAWEHRFAKLTVEAPGQATFTHIFDAPGDIDDLVELPSHE